MTDVTVLLWMLGEVLVACAVVGYRLVAVTRIRWRTHPEGVGRAPESQEWLRECRLIWEASECRDI